MPIVLYFLVNVHSVQTLHGWAIPTATDVAFSLAAMHILLKNHSPVLQGFLMTLAVVDDIIGVLLIAVGFSHITSLWPLLGSGVCLAVWWRIMKSRRTPWILAVLPAVCAWYGFLAAGVHPVLSAVAMGLLTPAKRSKENAFSRAAAMSRSFKPFSAFVVLPLFSFVSMGIPLSALRLFSFVNPVFFGVVMGLVCGKPLGIVLATTLCRLAGLRLHPGIRFGDLYFVAQLSGIGFTMSFLIANITFADKELTDMALIGVLTGSILSFLISTAFSCIRKARSVHDA